MRKNRREIKQTLPANIHLANKNEARLLRQMRAKSKSTELEIRAIKDNRKKLSEAQDAGEKMLNWYQQIQQRKKRILKSLTLKYKLAKEHPTIQNEFKQICQSLRIL